MAPTLHRLIRARRAVLLCFICVIARAALATAAPADATDEPWLHPYTGPTRTDVDATTLDGKVLCGYQGWFNTPGDGTKFGFSHWGQRLEHPGDGRFVVDMWPDVSEYDPNDLAAVPGLRLPDGSPARLYSAFRPGPVLLHFKWMRQYGIDGVFLSRFEGETASPARARHVNSVLANVRQGAHREGRVWAMMLDLSMGSHPRTDIVINDWKFLCDQAKVRDDSRYLHQDGKPVVLLWGLGLRDRYWTPQQAVELIRFFKEDPHYGGVYLIGGVDPYWRTLRGGCERDPAWEPIYRSFDAISPWDAGRYRDDASMDHARKAVWEPDLGELKPLGKGYMPTAFPGFSWDNLQQKPPGTTTIPRRKGEFYWRQFAIFRELGIRTVFVGMFDEVNEGTAIYKVASATPVGQHFVTYEGLPSDWYLRLTGAATRMIRGEAPLSATIPNPLPERPAEAETRPSDKPAGLSRSLGFGDKYHATIDYTQIPELRPWIDQKLAPVVEAWYPKIVQMLSSDGFAAPTHFSIVFEKDAKGVAWTAGTHIVCAGGWFSKELDREAVGAVVHEMVHVVQQYGLARRHNRRAEVPGWLVEGIPDYIRWFLYEPQSHGADRVRNPDRARYDAAYRESANFLDFVTRKYDKDLVPTLNAALRDGKYNANIWKKLTGKPVEELADEWKAALKAGGGVAGVGSPASAKQGGN